MKTNIVNHTTHNNDITKVEKDIDDVINNNDNDGNKKIDTNENKESVDDPLRIELLLLLQNFPFPLELNKDVVAVQK